MKTVISIIIIIALSSCVSTELMLVKGTYTKDSKEMMYGRVKGHVGADREARASKRKLKAYNGYLLMMDTTIIHDYRYEVYFRKTKVKR